jgi:hypothetical protein
MFLNEKILGILNLHWMELNQYTCYHPKLISCDLIMLFACW